MSNIFSNVTVYNKSINRYDFHFGLKSQRSTNQPDLHVEWKWRRLSKRKLRTTDHNTITLETSSTRHVLWVLNQCCESYTDTLRSAYIGSTLWARTHCHLNKAQYQIPGCGFHHTDLNALSFITFIFFLFHYITNEMKT